MTQIKPHQDDEIGKAEEAAFCQQCNEALKSISPGSCGVLTSFRMGDSVTMTFRKYSECLAPKITIPMGPI